MSLHPELNRKIDELLEETHEPLSEEQIDAALMHRTAYFTQRRAEGKPTPPQNGDRLDSLLEREKP